VSAETLRRAAEAMRRDAEGVNLPFTSPTMLAAAGFLDAIAHRQASGSDLRWPHPEDVEWAEQIARAYLAERDA
jgi:hypothetical protein